MIFISHNHADKPLVEHVAMKIANVFGQDKVFYDSWSIQPGDGIIDRMSEALAQCTHFFFFVSANSLKSKMVSLEWQNALIKATKGHCKLIPVRCDQSELPPIMAQTLYIDLYSVGMDAAVAQMVDVIKGMNTFKGANQPFSNLSFSLSGTEKELVVTINAKHYLEPIGNFLILMGNSQSEFTASPIDEDPYKGGFNAGVRLNNGQTTNGYLITVFRGITPAMPLRVRLNATGAQSLQFGGVLHQKAHDRWEGIPIEVATALPVLGQ